MKDEILELINKYGAEIMEHTPSRRRYRVGKYMIIKNLKPTETFSITDENGEVDMPVAEKQEIFDYARKHPCAKVGNTLDAAMAYLRNNPYLKK